jgi:hypothetical protein
MAKLTYTRDEDDFIAEASKIEFTISEDMDIYEFHTICIRLAHSVGYHHQSIEDAFGGVQDHLKQSDEEKEFMKQLLKG